MKAGQRIQAARATERRTGVIPIRMGAMGEREFDLMVVPKNDSPARVFVHSFKAFVGHMLTLQSLREKERAQSAVFSPSEFVTCEDGVFASQAMVRLLAKARLAAATDYGVSSQARPALARRCWRDLFTSTRLDPPATSYLSTARASRSTWSRASCLAIGKGPSPEPPMMRRASFEEPPEERCSWTRSATLTQRCSRNCCDS